MKSVTIQSHYHDPAIQWIDVRSPIEYQEDHIFASINFPVLTDEERHEVGELYRDDKERAKSIAFQYGEEKVHLLESLLKTISQSGKTIGFYCYRGGLRSTVPAKFFSERGYPVVKLEGGYKAYRNFVRSSLYELSAKRSFVVLHGYTGVGKSEALNLLKDGGYPILHLESLAQNGGSLFGDLLYRKDSPSQKRFESLLLESLYPQNQQRIFVEMESRRIGRITVPEDLYQSIVNSPIHILMETTFDCRIRRILNDYLPPQQSLEPNHYMKINEKITLFKKSLGSLQVKHLLNLAEQNNYYELVKILLEKHYDPLYRKSVESFKNQSMIFRYTDLPSELLPWLEKHKVLRD